MPVCRYQKKFKFVFAKMRDLEFKRLKPIIIKVMRENPTLDRNGILTFSRTVPSFYTLLVKTVFC